MTGMNLSRIVVALALASSTALAQGPNAPTAPSGPAPVAPTAPAPTAPAPREAANEMSPNDIARFLAFFDDLVDVVVHDAESCDKMAFDVSALLDASQPTMAIARAAHAAHKHMPEAAQYHLLDGVRRMSSGVENCSGNAHVKAAFAKLDEDHAKQ
jgi:hypothetical protein